MAYDTNRFATPVGSLPDIAINGMSLYDVGFICTTDVGTLMAPTQGREAMNDHRPGSISYGPHIQNWGFALSGTVGGLTLADMNKRMDEFRNWLSELQHKPFTYMVGQPQMNGLMFEVRANRHWYQTGTVTGTATTRTLTGSGTLWTEWVAPDTTLEIINDTTKYTVVNVVGDTELELDPVLATSPSGAAYRVETRRYLIVNLEGESSTEALGSQGFLSQTDLKATTAWNASHANTRRVTLNFMTRYPFWIGDQFRVKKTSVVSGTFYSIPNIGAMPSNPIYRITGATSNPKITAANTALVANFETSLDAAIIHEGTLRAGSHRDELDVVAGIVGNGLLSATAGDNITFTSMVNASTPGSPIADHLNLNQGCFIILLKPDFASTDVTTRYILDAGSFEVKWNGASTRFEATDGTNTAFVTATFSANDSLSIVVNWNKRAGEDATPTGELLGIWLNGTTAGATYSASYTATNVAQTIYIGTDAVGVNTFTGTLDEIAIFDYQLRPEQIAGIIADIYNSGSPRASSVVAGNIPLVYFTADDNTGSMREFRLPVSATTTTSLTVGSKGTLFRDNQLLCCYDEFGWSAGFMVNGAPTATNIPIDNGAGGAVTDLANVGAVANFDGTADGAGGAVLDIQEGDMVVDGWFATTTTTRQTIVAKANDDSDAGYQFYLDTSGRPAVYLRETASATFNHTMSVNDGIAHRVTWIVDRSGTARILIDNANQETFAGGHLNGDSLTNSRNFTVGATSNGSNRFTGQMRSLRFYGSGGVQFLGGTIGMLDNLRTVGGRRQFETATVNGRAEDGFWKFISATTLGEDSSASGNDLTMNGVTRTQSAFVSPNLVADPENRNGNLGSIYHSAEVATDPPHFALSNTALRTYRHDNSIFHSTTGASSIYGAKKVWLQQGKSYRLAIWFNTAATQTDHPNLTIYDVTTAASLFDDDTTMAIVATDADDWVLFDFVLNIAAHATELHEIDIRFSTQAATDVQTYYGAWLLTESFVAVGDAESTTGWSQIGTLDSFTTTATEYAGVNAILWNPSATSEGISAVVSSLRSNSCYEATVYTRGSAAAQSTASLQGYTAATGNTSMQLTPAGTGKDHHDYDRYNMMFRTGSDVDGTIQIIADGDLAADRYTDSVIVAERYGFDATTGADLIPKYRVGSHNTGILIAPAGPGVVYEDVPQRLNQLGLIVRCEPKYDSDTASTDDRYYVLLHDSTTADQHRYALYYDVSADEFVFEITSGGTSDLTFKTDAVNFNSGNGLKISLWFNTAGVVDKKDGVTYYGKIFVNDVVRGTLTSTKTAPLALDRANIGENRVLGMAQDFADSIIEDVALFTYAPTDEELKRYYMYRPVQSDNTTVTVTKTLDADDIVSVSTGTGMTHFLDASAGTEAILGKEVSGGSPSFVPRNRNFEQTIYVEAGATIPELHIIHRPHF